MPRDSISKRSLAILAIGGAAFCALVPWFHYGIPSGHDFEFHFNSWLEVLGHWRQGVIYPHWAAWAHYGYGEARFIFYPPVSWTLGGILSAILPWKAVPGAFTWLALTAAGVSMYVVAKRWLSPSEAVLAAIFYALNPYHLIVIYWRSAFAELICATYLPLLLLCVIQLPEKGRQMIAPIALLLAAGWLTNIPSAVMMHYTLAGLVLWITISTRRWSPLLCMAIAVIAGVALAAVYLLPVWHQRMWVSLDQVLSPGVGPQENFLFAHTTDVEHDKFNLLISVLAVGELVVIAFACLFWRGKRMTQLRRPVLVVGTTCILIMLPFTSELWKHLPELRYVQFPWRWMLVFNMVLVLAIVAGLRRWWSRSLAFALLLAPVLVGGQRILAPWWDHTGDLWQMVDDQHDRIGNEGVDEYAPVGVDPYDVDQSAPLVKFEGPGSAHITIKRWNAEDRVIQARNSAPGMLVLKLFNYPKWQVTVNGREGAAGMTEKYEMTMPVQPGDNLVEVRFRADWDRRAGAGISVATLFAIALWYKRGSGRSASLRANG